VEYRIHCQNPRCGKVSKATGARLQFIKKSAAKGMDFIMVECPKCFGSVSYNPQDADGRQEPQSPEPLYACPCKTCDGFICHVTNAGPAFWGCGECGEEWRTRAALFKSITEITKTYAYRKQCYRKVKSGWLPVEPDDYDRGAYERLVHSEWEKPAPTASKGRNAKKRRRSAKKR
jgi:hypothetical protein